jgi:hypothetical protein
MSNVDVYFVELLKLRRRMAWKPIFFTILTFLNVIDGWLF